MPKQFFRCLVLIPVGPRTVPNFLNDTIESVNHHLGESECLVCLIDDSGKRAFHYATSLCPNVKVIDAPAISAKKPGTLLVNGPLFVKEIYAIKILHSLYRFDVMLKMDTDSLVIGPAVHEDALSFFDRHPQVGMAGAFTVRGDGSCKKQAMARKGRLLEREMSFRHGWKHWRMRDMLRRLDSIARRNNYRRGDTCTGGGYFMAARLIDAFADRGLLDLDELRHSSLTEDTLMSLITCASGFTLSDLPNDVLAINWGSFPMPLEELVSRGKKLLHPVKLADPAAEQKIRQFFKQQRLAAGVCS